MPALVSAVTVEWAPASDPLDDTPSWVDITSYVRSVSIRRGRSGAFDLYGAGRATIVLNNGTGNFDQTAWHRWRQVRVTALATGPVTLEVYYGFVDTILHSQPGVPGAATATIQSIDLMGIMSRYEYVASSVPVETGGWRIYRVLLAAGIPLAWMSIPLGYTNIAPPADGVVNALQHMQDVAEAEVGALFVSRQGIMAFEDRYDQLRRLDSGPEATFSNTPTGSELKMLMGDMTLTPPGRDYRNRVTFTAASGVPQTADDVPSGYPSDSLSRTVPVDSDSQAMANANTLLEVFKQQTTVWPEHVTVSMHTQNAIDRVCPLDLRRYCLVKFTPAGRSQQSYKVYVESIDHTITPDTWFCRIGFSSADRWEAAWGTRHDYLIIGDATYGLIGTGKIGPH